MTNAINIRKGYYKKVSKKFDNSFFLCLFVFLSCFIFPLFESFGLPHFLFFANDLIVTFMLFILMTKRRLKHPSFIIPIVLFFIAGIFSLAAGNADISLFLWSIRNFYRFYVFFFFVINFLSFNSLKTVFSIIKILFLINFLLTIIEFACGIKGDYLGGIFGWTKGVNSSTTAFIFMTYCFFLLSCLFNNTVSIYELLAVLLESLIIAALAELKFLIVSLLAITVLLVLISKFSVRKWAFLLTFSLAFVLCLYLVNDIFSINSFSLFTKVFWINYFSNSGLIGYNSTNDLNRTGFILKLNTFFSTSLLNQILGFGQGFAEVSSISIFQSPFASNYADILHYNWFLSSFLYIEMGYFGMIAYLSFFFGLLLFFLKRHKFIEGKFGIIITLFSIILFFYNFSLRTDSSGYLIYAYLAFSIIAIDYNETNRKIKKGKRKCF